MGVDTQRETRGRGTRHPSEGYGDKERWRETKTGDGVPQGRGCRSRPRSVPPQSPVPHACRCCCTSSAMPTTTCWASTPPSASPCARVAAAAMGSASPQGCVSASRAGGAPPQLEPTPSLTCNPPVTCEPSFLPLARPDSTFPPLHSVWLGPPAVTSDTPHPKSLLNLLQYCLFHVLVFWLQGTSALEGEILTTRLPGKSHDF